MFTFGLIAFSLAFALSLAGLVLALIALVRHTPLGPQALRLSQASFGLHTLAVLALLILQATEDFSIAYVNSVINPAMPSLLRMTALWGGQAGSLFFWSWVLNLCFFLLVSTRRQLVDAWTYLMLAINVLFFAGISLFIENPFARVWQLADGSLAEGLFAPQAGAFVYHGLTGVGLNPLLRHPGMVIHPPILYLGFGLFLVPFAVAAGQLLRGDPARDLLEQTRGWLIASWVLLTAGIVLGSWWSYDVLGWGGYWAWDPVETASLLPWLSSTALLHSLLAQRQRGIFHRLNVLLTLLSYVLVVFSIFVTRAGVLSSVHAFGESSISRPLMIFTILTAVFALGLFIWRWKKLNSNWQLTQFFTREALLLYTDLLLMAILLVCLWGLVYPLTSGLFSGQQITLGRGYFDRSTLPLFILLVVLMGICPLIGWSAASLKKLGRSFWPPLLVALAGTAACWLAGIRAWTALGILFVVFLGLAVQLALTIRDASSVGLKRFPGLWWKQRSRYGAYLVHAGVLLIALGIMGVEVLGSGIEGTLIPGDRMPLGRYEVEFNGITSDFDNPEYLNVSIQTTLYQDGQVLDELTPGQHIYMDRQQSITIPQAHSSLRGDVYVLVMDYNLDMPYATLRLIDNPLVNWMWIGGLVMVLGGALAGSVTPAALRRDEELPGGPADA